MDYTQMSLFDQSAPSGNLQGPIAGTMGTAIPVPGGMLNNDSIGLYHRIIGQMPSREKAYRVDTLTLPSYAKGFHQVGDARIYNVAGKRPICYIPGKVAKSQQTDMTRCKVCGYPTTYHSTSTIDLTHLPLGGNTLKLVVLKKHVKCTNPKCNHFELEPIPFQADEHRITRELEVYIRDLLAQQSMTLKQVAAMTGVNRNIIKDIDKKRLQELYTVEGKGEELKAPKTFSEQLGIDEFLLHEGNRFATVIMDIKSGHVLYFGYGKKKQVVYDFINWVGMEWMRHVKVLACDMNSDYEEAFREKCPWISVVFDHFHIVKNFNEKVIAEVRKDEQKRLIDEGKVEEAKALKGSKYILMSNRSTLAEKDANAGEIVVPGNMLFGKAPVIGRRGFEARYDTLVSENRLFFAIDYIKESLDAAYKCKDAEEMLMRINDVLDVCYGTENKRFLWFANLLLSHIEGIVSHAEYQVSSGKVEGTNRMIKTMRWQAYGFADDEYFFLKIMDASRR